MENPYETFLPQFFSNEPTIWALFQLRFCCSQSNPINPPGKALLKYIKIPFSHQFSCWLRSRLRSSYQRCSLRLSGVWLRRWLGEIASPPVFRMGKGGRSRLWWDTRLGRESPLCRFQVFPLLILDWLKMVQKNLWKVAPIYPLVNKHI